MVKKERVRRDFAALERRRLKAARLFEEGLRQSEVARRLGTSREAVRRWFDTWKDQGTAALKAAGRAGRLPKVSKEQLFEVRSTLRKGAREAGFATELWTLSRVAAIIERLTGVRYHPGHVWRILGQLGWSPQRPIRRASERNESGVAAWKREQWPRIKKKRRGVAPGLSSSTKPESPNKLPSFEPGPLGESLRSSRSQADDAESSRSPVPRSTAGMDNEGISRSKRSKGTTTRRR